MNWADYAILGVILISALIGLGRGFIREALSLAVWVAALGGAWLYHRDAAELLVAQISNPSARLAVAFVGLVLGILILGAILGAILTFLVDKARLTGLDRALGFVFGAGRGAVIVSMAVLLGALTPLPDEAWWKESRTIGQFRTAGDWMLSLVPPEIQDQLKKV
jgi:membrane protein required for colicin V production